MPTAIQRAERMAPGCANRRPPAHPAQEGGVEAPHDERAEQARLARVTLAMLAISSSEASSSRARAEEDVQQVEVLPAQLHDHDPAAAESR